MCEEETEKKFEADLQKADDLNDEQKMAYYEEIERRREMALRIIELGER